MKLRVPPRGHSITTLPTRVRFSACKQTIKLCSKDVDIPLAFTDEAVVGGPAEDSSALR